MWRNSIIDLSDIADGSEIHTDLADKDEDGNVISLPSDITAVGMFINKTLFDEAGVAYPTSEDDIWTWDEYVAAVKEVQAATGTTYGMVMDKSSHRLKAFLYEFGSDYFQPDDSGEFSTNDRTKAALEYFNSLNDDSFMPRSVWLSDADPNALFKSGDVVSYLSGSWQIADFAVNIADFEWASVYMPQEEERATNFGNAASVVVFEGPQQEAAHDFIKWLYEPENYTELSETSSFIPAVDGLDITYAAHADAFGDLQPGHRRLAADRGRDQGDGAAVRRPGRDHRRRPGARRDGEVPRRRAGRRDDDREHQRAVHRPARRLGVTVTGTTILDGRDAEATAVINRGRRMRRVRRPRRRSSTRFVLAPLGFIVIAVVLFALFFLWPGALGLWYSFTDYTGVGTPDFIGLENYVDLAQDATFYGVLGRTILYTVLSVPLHYVAALGIAMLLTSSLAKGKTAARIIFFLPWLISPIVAGVIWKWLFGENFGVVNYLIELARRQRTPLGDRRRTSRSSSSSS